MKDCEGRTALVRAVMKKQESMVDLLLECQSADVDIPDKYGTNALHMSAQLGLEKYGSPALLHFFGRRRHRPVRISIGQSWRNLIKTFPADVHAEFRCD
ncbi:MAG: ankyrin repeat domain-containing protein [Gammaproteobacteria bacterium]|nr:ankyrin repeat domain-containing protein [Gammaproteobacteria bacterium]